MKIESPIVDGIFVFDSLPFLGVKHISEEYLPILNMLCEIINTDYRVTGETYFLSCFSFSSPEGHFGISRNITEGATLIENISRDYPPAEALRSPTDEHDTIDIYMHEELAPGFADRVAKRIEAIYQAYDIENSNVESYYFILTDENDRGWCRIRVSKSGPSHSETHYTVKAILSGDEFVQYRDKIEQAFSSRAFYADRAFEIW